MDKSRLESFSDSVLATLLTVMILQVGIPLGDEVSDFLSFSPIFMGYLTSFLFIAIYWVNHHLLFQFVRQVNVKILWCNIAWIFMMSFIPFATAWMGSYLDSPLPLVFYFADLLLIFLVFHLMIFLVSRENGEPFRPQLRSIVSLIVHIVTVAIAAFVPYVPFTLMIVLGIWWIIPQKMLAEGIPQNEEE